jgi:hypothetical protein
VYALENDLSIAATLVKILVELRLTVTQEALVAVLRVAPDCATELDRRGRTPLHLAVKASSLAMYGKFVTAMVELAPECVKIRDMASSRTAFQFATPEYKVLMRKLLGDKVEG